MSGDILGKAVGCVVVRDGRVLLVRHTYGAAKGKLLIPGGHIRQGEMPEDAAVREVFEETGIEAKPEDILCLRFQPENWYVVYRMKYISGEPRTDNTENSQAFFTDIKEAQFAPDITELSRLIVASLDKPGLGLHTYFSEKSTPDKYRLYGL